jgi:N-methylhydantoinase A
MSKLAKQMGLQLEEAAQGVIDVANVNIDRAVRRVSIARGYDPRHFTLMAFGGAGPMQACAVAERLEMSRVLIPRFPGVLCAFGLLVADVLRDYSQSILQPVTEESLDELRHLLETMLAQARSDLHDEGIPSPAMTFIPSVDMRYAGQSFELNVPYGREIVQTFHATHEARYGHAMYGRMVEMVNVRLQAIGTVEKPLLEPESATTHHNAPVLQTQHGLAMIDREQLHTGMRFDGPALVFQLDSTVYVAAGWSAQVDGYHNLILER